MKILMVNKFLYPNGGSETYIFDLSQQLKKQGHKVSFFGMADMKNIVGNNLNLEVTSVNFHRKSLKQILYPFKIVYSVEAKKKIKRVIKDFQPDVVHLNNFNFQLTPSIIYEIKKHNIPIIYTAHDYQLVCPNHMCLDVIKRTPCEECLKKGYYECSRKRCIHGSKVKSLLGTLEASLYKVLRTYKKIDLIICPSLFMKDKLDYNQELRDRTVVLHNYVNKNMSMDEEAVQSIERKYILYFGRYEIEKGVMTLIHACTQIPDIYIKFAGRGPLKKEIDQLKNGVDCGFVSPNVLKELIQGAEFVVCPSEWYENCPFSIMEAIIQGKPVIGSRMGGIPELIHDGETGLLFDSGNVKDLKEKIELLWNNQEVCNQFGQRCMQEDFDSLKRYTEKMCEFYRQLIDKDK